MLPSIRHPMTPPNRSKGHSMVMTPRSPRRITSPAESGISRLSIQKTERFFEELRQKLGYEWPKIYRKLITKDEKAEGVVPIKFFFSECKSLTREEDQKLIRLFGLGENIMY